MSVFRWRYTEECEGRYCCGDCDKCDKEDEPVDNLIIKRSATERLIIAKTLLESVLQDMPTAEPRKGKWIDERGVGYCSVCGKTPDIWCSFDESEWKYCPLCGARMEES